MKLTDCNPYVRMAQIQPAVLEGAELRRAYDHRIFYILEGEGWLMLEHGKYPLSPDRLIFLQPEEPYYFKGRMKVAVLNFDLGRSCAHRTEPLCPPPLASYESAMAFEAGQEGFPRWQSFADQGHLRSLVLEITDSFRKGDPYGDAVTSGLLKKMLAQLFAAPPPEHGLARRVERYIELHAATLSGNGELGTVFGYHPVYLESVFKKATGRTLHQALLEHRLALACRFLIRTDHPVEEIAFDVGFSSRSHFCTAFKARFGCSPLQYRVKNNKFEKV